MEQDKKTPAKKSVKKWTEEEKLAYCNACQQSGLSRSAFCRREELSLPTFCAWLKQQRSAVSHLSVPGMKFMAASVTGPISEEEQTLEVRLTNGLQCRFLSVINVKQICEIIEGLQHVITN